MTFHRSAAPAAVALAALAALLAIALTAPAPAPAAPRVPSMVVGQDGVLAGLRTVTAEKAWIRVRGRRCRVAAGTPLAVLIARGTPMRLRDHGRCSRRPADASGLYVAKLGPDRARGQAGWVYKVGRKVGTTGAADPSGPFGTGRRLRSGQPLLWFWCVSAGACQRTLEIDAPRRVRGGTELTVVVHGYDDQGDGEPVAEATIDAGAQTVVTDAEGHATITAPERGRLLVRASKEGLVDAVPRVVRIR